MLKIWLCNSAEKKTDKNNQQKDSATQLVLTNRHFMHNTINKTTYKQHDT